MHDPRVPPDDECVLRALLDKRAAAQGDAPFVVFEDGRTWSYAETARLVRGTAAAFAKLGLRQGERVLAWMQNGPDLLRLWLAANYMGLVFVPINTSYRGRPLGHVITDARAAVMLAEGAFLDRLGSVEHGMLRTVVVFGEGRADGIENRPASVLDPIDEPAPELSPSLRPWDAQLIHYTSGTTGPSKGVVVSYLHLYSMAEGGMYFAGRSDRFMVNLPLFHIGGTMYVYGALMMSGSISLPVRYRTETFWETVRATGTTSCLLLGSIADFLLKQPASPDDRRHRLKNIAIIPYTKSAGDFASRFGVSVFTFFDMTEISAPLASGPDPLPFGTCGRVRPGYDVRIVDEFDREVPIGAIGELIVRCDRPWAASSGYFEAPAATAAAWRNGWFHTGDAFRRDGNGNYFFVDRIKDTIRRRGENISSLDIETEVIGHPDVQEAAAIGVPSEYSEEEVMLVVAPKPGRRLAPADLAAFLAEKLPPFMVPRYVRVLDQLPRTETNKVRKRELRAEGVVAGTWDRLSHQRMEARPSR